MRRSLLCSELHQSIDQSIKRSINQSLSYADDRVWVGLQGGQLLIYERHSLATPESPTRSVTPLWSIEWLLESPRSVLSVCLSIYLSINCSPVCFKDPIFSPIAAIASPTQRIWAAAGNQVHIIRESRHEVRMESSVHLII